MSGAKKDSTVYDSHQFAASQNKRAGRGKLLQIVLYNTGKLYSYFQLLVTTKVFDKFHIEIDVKKLS